MPRQRLRARRPFGQRRHTGMRLQRVLRRYQPPDGVKLQPFQGLAADIDVSLMGRVERTAEQADTLPARVRH